MKVNLYSLLQLPENINFFMALSIASLSFKDSSNSKMFSNNSTYK